MTAPDPEVALQPDPEILRNSRAYYGEFRNRRVVSIKRFQRSAAVERLERLDRLRRI